MTGLHVADVHKSFGAQAVLTGVDLSVPVGSLTAILGPSGSGKTTLLRIVAGFERSDRGTVRLSDRIVEDDTRALPPEQRGIGYVPQEGALFPHLTVDANVLFGVRRHDRKKLADGPSALLEMVGLGGLGHRYPHQLSGGQQQRVALARALAIRPALVLLDEPFSSLDASLRSTVRADVQQVLKEAGTTAVLVTHDQDEALSMADQVAVIRHGRIGQCGPPQTLYDHPVDPHMATFLGEANLVDAEVVDTAVLTPFGRMPLRPGPDRSVPSGSVVALVRPEQLSLSTAAEGPGLRARVVRTEFHGHDTVVTTVPVGRAEDAVITVRVEGDVVVADGTQVRLTAHGTAAAWPRTGS